MGRDKGRLYSSYCIFGNCPAKSLRFRKRVPLKFFTQKIPTPDFILADNGFKKLGVKVAFHQYNFKSSKAFHCKQLDENKDFPL